MQNQRKLFLFIAMSLDGYIAGPGGDISFLSRMEKEGEDYGYSRFIESVDTVVLGRKTYDKILSMGIEWPYGSRKVYVLSRTARPNAGMIQFYNGNLKDFILELKSHKGKNIYCDGGAETIHQLLSEELIDEMIVSIVPVLLGDGISLFKSGFQQRDLQLINTESFEKGLVKLHYILQKK